MNYGGVLFLLGRLQLALGVVLLVPAAVAWYLGGDEASAFLVSAAIAGVAGVTCEWAFRQPRDFKFGRREAFLLVSSVWVIASILGALPYVLVKGWGFAADALFEAASGFTTTGASVLTDIESEPAGLLLWRSLTQWLGGMGIIVLGIAILPKLAVGGMELLGAEAPGPIAEKLTPRIAQTAKALWAIYLLLTLTQTSVLMLLGMGALDAVNHAFATMATGGFSTRAGSVGDFSPAIQIVVTFFMVAAGVNFALHFRLLRGKPAHLLKDSEFRFYIGVLVVATILLTGNLLAEGTVSQVGVAARHGAFQAASIVTTTGFATTDFDRWPDFSRALLFILMFVGGCAGSTGGSVKVVRILIVSKKLIVELKRIVQPHAVLPVRVGRRAIPEDVVTSVMAFFALFMTLFAFGGLLLTAFDLDLVSAYSAVAACLGNIGPGFIEVGPMQNYAGLAVPAKLILVGLMIVGRLELYTVLVTLFLIRRSL